MAILLSNLNHPLRIPLAAEIHSRPFLKLDAPERVSHFAVYRDSLAEPFGSNQLVQQRLLADLCLHFGVAAPSVEAKYFYHDFGRFRLKWECHTEFATYTFAERIREPLPLAVAFASMPVLHLPETWLLGLEGKIMVAAHVVLERSAQSTAEFAEGLGSVFEVSRLVGSQVMQGGELWTDFAIHPSGFSQFVIRDAGMQTQQAGRLVQRVLEIETYRMMALLGLPFAQQAMAALNDIEGELAALATAMVATDAAADEAPAALDGRTEQTMLDNITRLAARIEKLSLENSYRFSAAKAYFRLVNARIDELREVRLEAIPMVAEFMDRRLAPAMNTCAATASRQEALAQRIANTNDLLRTRVGIVQELQNRQILQSMNRRAAQQLRLQQAVEGLSVAAISYYVVGLLSYEGKLVKALGWIGNPDIFVGALVPLVALGVWLGLRRLHKSLPVEQKAHDA